MNSLIFALYDKKSNNYQNVFVSVNVDVAKRSTALLMVNDSPVNSFRHFASDYELHQIGEIDLKTGDITPCKNFICNFTELMEVK